MSKVIVNGNEYDITRETILNDVKEGMTILLDDGFYKLIVESIEKEVKVQKEDDLLRCRVLEVYTDRGSRWAVKSALVMLNTMTGYVADMPLSYNFLNNSRLFLEV